MNRILSLNKLTFTIVILIVLFGCISSNKKEMTGQQLFKKYCVQCHGVNGKLQLNGAKDLTLSPYGKEERIRQVTYGKGLMTPFKDILSKEEIEKVVKYTFELEKSLNGEK